MKAVPLHVLAATRTAVADSPSNAQRLSLAPHRIAFFVATALLLAVSFGWVWMLVAAHTGTTVVTALPPTTAHAFIFAAAYMPLYITGFTAMGIGYAAQVPASQVADRAWIAWAFVQLPILLKARTVRGPG